MDYNKYKYVGLLGLFSLIGLRAFWSHEYMYLLAMINLVWFTFFYENSLVYKKTLKVSK
ncbi:DUF3796 domain-containing protein [Clostridium septicum]|uniref:DUF3796 domain-containing protein n=1 Tax=Clostridium septicum TaxID=1504 RepID=A0ABY5AZ41_CLOSE|nr:DUF3796 domain-containing protein [Clostridium septicum]MDU1313067.1 DUF3796 domain-containing protein [Clostridium septicum]QAS59502.1 DUF3796 domain-containing protein [Clostridium septicum]UEC21237.1 DUF3796 domain-containing protein [Clostridium septicum]USS00717.1 DUF3796 domain-containing protein [Clostridium septicum]WLF69258.1 DUF3796 domain-containing protein [Clostridium septicum]